MFKPSSDYLTDLSKAVLLMWIPLLYMFHVCIYYTIVSFPCSLVFTCCELAALLALLCVVFSCAFVTFPYGVPGQVWCLIVSIPDLYITLYFQFIFNVLSQGCINSNLSKPGEIEKGVYR